MSLAEVSIRRYVLTIMLMAFLVTIGIVGWSRLGIDMFPEISLPTLTVTTIYPGAGPSEVETLVTKKIEDAISSEAGIEDLSSTSQEGMSLVTVGFTLGKNIDVAAQDVREKINLILNDLPTDAKIPIIAKLDITAIPVVTYGFASSTMTATELRDYVSENVKRAVEQVNGVAQVSIVGGKEREFRVDMRKDALEAADISPNAVAMALAGTNFNFPAGSIQDAGQDFTVKVMSQFATIKDLQNTVIDTKRMIRLRDIADVTDSYHKVDQYSRLNGEDAVQMTVQKQSGTNTVLVSDAIKAKVEALRSQMPPSVTFHIAQDNTVFIRGSIREIYNNIILGSILATIIVLVFLGSARSTFAIFLSIPISLITTFFFFYIAGFTLNLMSLMALAVVVGLVVDDAIVVMENIYRHNELGKTTIRAAVDGTKEIGLAVIAATLSIVAVFIPIGFTGGVIGQFFRQFGLGVVFSVLVSLVVALTLIPMVMAYTYSEHVPDRKDFFSLFNRRFVLNEPLGRMLRYFSIGPLGRLGRPSACFILALALSLVGIASFGMAGRLGIPPLRILGAVLIPVLIFTIYVLATFAWVVAFRLIRSLWILLEIFADRIARWFNRYYKPFEASYVNLLKWALGNRLLVIAIGAGSFLLTFPILALMQKDLIPRFDQGQYTVSIQAPPDADLDTTDTIVRQVEKVISTQPGVDAYSTTVGTISGGGILAGQSAPNIASVVVKLVPVAERRGHSSFDLMLDARKRLRSVAGALIQVATGGMGGQSPIYIQVSDNDEATLSKTVATAKSILEGIDGAINVDTSNKPGKMEVRIIPDIYKVADLGLTPVGLASILRTYVEGLKVSTYREAGEEYDITMYMAQASRDTVQKLKSLRLYSPALEAYVPVTSMCDIDLAEGPTKIERHNRTRTVNLTADTDPSKRVGVGDIISEFQRKLAESGALKPTTIIDYSGESRRYGEMLRDLGLAMFLGIVLTYMVLSSQFNSFIHPFNIMLALPLAIVGAVLLLFVTGQSFSLLSFIGIIMLTGMVTKNSILLIDYTNTLRTRDGMERTAALLKAGPTRLRPILMTTLTAVLALVPVALGIGEGAGFRRPMAIAIIGGLTLSTLLTLIVIPVTYALTDDLVKRWMGGNGKNNGNR
jgi:HAE1 family hydrophobic/amphiphilic exporter-1